MADLRSPTTILTSWTLRPGVALLLVVVGGLYLLGAATVRRRTGRSFPRQRRRFYLAGWITLVVALASPVDRYSHLLLSVHMVQHLLLTMVAAPLLLLGAPITLALQASSPRIRQRVLLPALHSWLVKILSHPVVAWSVFAAVMWASHFSPLYERALENETVHGLEHLMYLGAALLFWWPVVGVDPSPSRLSHPARLLYLFLSMPQSALLGLAIYDSDRLLYPHYLATSPRLGQSALSDQHLAGAIMWTTGMFFIVPALALVLVNWMNREEREGARIDARIDAQTAAGTADGRAARPSP
jgi:putative copper resistance protein D